jgi:hypothetical protein
VPVPDKKVNFASITKANTPEKKSSFMSSVHKFSQEEPKQYAVETNEDYQKSSPKKVRVITTHIPYSSE